jgi:hypothetical protein
MYIKKTIDFILEHVEDKDKIDKEFIKKNDWFLSHVVGRISLEPIDLRSIYKFTADTTNSCNICNKFHRKHQSLKWWIDNLYQHRDCNYILVSVKKSQI